MLYLKICTQKAHPSEALLAATGVDTAKNGLVEDPKTELSTFISDGNTDRWAQPKGSNPVV